MKRVKVIKRVNLPAKLPFTLTAVIYLLLDKFNATEWIWGASGIILLIMWVGSITALFMQDDVDIFDKSQKHV